MRFIGSLVLLILISSASYAQQGKTPICPDTFGWKYGNFFANCVSDRLEDLSFQIPGVVKKCDPPNASNLNSSYTLCLQRNFDQARLALQLSPRRCQIAQTQSFHTHSNQRWVSCVRQQIKTIEAAISSR